MIGRTTKIITGAIAVAMVAVFSLGLSHSISTGFAGFLGGLPFAIITVFVLVFIGYDYWEDCIRRRDDNGESSTKKR